MAWAQTKGHSPHLHLLWKEFSSTCEFAYYELVPWYFITTGELVVSTRTESAPDPDLVDLVRKQANIHPHWNCQEALNPPQYYRRYNCKKLQRSISAGLMEQSLMWQWYDGVTNKVVQMDHRQKEMNNFQMTAAYKVPHTLVSSTTASVGSDHSQ